MNDKDKALEIIAGCSNWSDIQHRIVPRIVAALTAARREAREAAFKDAKAVAMKRGEIIHRGNLIAALEAAANTEEGGGDA